MMWGYDFGWGWLLMSLGMVLWIALLVVLVWAVIRWLTTKTMVSPRQDSATPVGGPSALEMLRQRYVRGEIDTATFEQMRAQLEAPGVRDEQPVTARR
jgi:putative membrane protein